MQFIILNSYLFRLVIVGNLYFLWKLFHYRIFFIKWYTVFSLLTHRGTKFDILWGVGNFLIYSDIFLEKHWRSVISRSVCDYYLEAQRANPNDIPPVIATPHHYLLSIQRGGVSFVAVCMEEIPPLFVIEFLHRIVDTFQVSVRKMQFIVVIRLLRTCRLSRT